MNVLAIVPNQVDALAYIPIKVLVPKVDMKTSFALIMTVLVITVITIILLILSLYFCKRYFKFKQQIEYEQADIRNMASLSKTSTELGEINKEKYSTLTEDISKI